MPFIPSGGGNGNIDENLFMKKSQYDTNEDGIVDKASSVDDGQGNAKTAEEIKNHIENTNIHPSIDDSTASSSSVWSSQKVNSELSQKADINHTHPWSDIDKTGSKLEDLENIDTSNLQDGYVLKWDSANNKWVPGSESSGGASTWQDLDKTGSKLIDIEDVDGSNLTDGKILKWNATLQKWIPSVDETSEGSGGSEETVTQVRFVEITGATRNDTNSFSVDDVPTNADIFKKGRPLRYKANIDDTWLYGIVKEYNAGVVSISGASLPDPLGYIQYGVPELVVVKDIFINENPLTPTGESDDLLSGGTASGTSYDGYGPYTNAIDDDTGTYWRAEAGNYLQYTWDNPKIVNKYRFLLGDYIITGWKFEGSNDGNNWDLLDEKTNQTPSTGSWNEYVISNTTPYKYYKFTVTSIQSGRTYIGVYEVEFKYFQEGDKYELITGKQFVWEYPPARLVAVRGRTSQSPEGGSTVFNVGKNDWQNFIFSNSLSISDNNWVESDNSLDIEKYVFQKGDRIFVNVTEVASTFAGANLELQFIFVLDALDIYETLPPPEISGDSEVLENNTIQNTITNYDSGALYTVSFDNPLLSGSISGDTITINAGDITDEQDHIVNMTVSVQKAGYYGNSTTKAIRVKYYVGDTDDAFLISGVSYTTDNFDEINDGSITS